MTDEEFRGACNVFGFTPSRALREMLDTAIGQAVVAERHACAKVCDARALKNEQACDGADADETSSLRSAAWQISVCAAAIRARGQA